MNETIDKILPATKNPEDMTFYELVIEILDAQSAMINEVMGFWDKYEDTEPVRKSRLRKYNQRIDQAHTAIKRLRDSQQAFQLYTISKLGQTTKDYKYDR